MHSRCVCCGEEVPEGRMICRKCEIKSEQLSDAVFKVSPEQQTALDILNLLEDEKAFLLGSKKILRGSSKVQYQCIEDLQAKISEKYFSKK